MIDPEEKDMQLFSWAALFAVTAFICFLFIAMLKLIGGDHISVFVFIGFTSLGLTIIFTVDTYIKARSSKKKLKKRLNDPFSY